MSQRAILLAVRDAIKSGLSLNASQCEVQFDGQPPPLMQGTFVAVHPSSWENRNDAGTCLDEFFGVDITVTVQARAQPQDRIGPNVLVGTAGAVMTKLLEQIRALVHLNYSIMTAANTTIGGGASGFNTPLWFKTADNPRAVGPDWFSAPPPDNAGILPPVGIAQTLHFREANRIQDIVSQT